MKFNRVGIVTDKDSWLNKYINQFIEKIKTYSDHVFWCHLVDDIIESDIVFYLSFSKIVPKKYLIINRHNLVVHASALPEGKGWSPMTWKIIEGKNQIPMTLFEADETLDSGKIYLQDAIHFEGHELIDELRHVQSNATLDLCLLFMKEYEAVVKNARNQSGESTFYNKRKKSDSRLDIDKSIRESFNLLRTVDNEKYPAFFEYLGHTYQLKIEKIKEMSE